MMLYLDMNLNEFLVESNIRGPKEDRSLWALNMSNLPSLRNLMMILLGFWEEIEDKQRGIGEGKQNTWEGFVKLDECA